MTTIGIQLQISYTFLTENTDPDQKRKICRRGKGCEKMTENKEPKKISGTLKKFFGVGDFGFSLMSNIDTYYASYFFTNIAKFSTGIVAVMTTISAVVDAVLSMLYGAFMNKGKPRKWGRYRSWLILTPWLVPFLYAGQFIRIGNGTAAVVFVTLAMITSRIAWNLPYVASISMINVAAKTSEDRMALSSSRSIWTSAASVLYSFVGPAVVSFFASVFGESNAYAATAFAFSCLMFAGMYAHFVMFKGYEPTGAEEEAAMAAVQKKASTAYKPEIKALDAIKCNPHLIALILSDMLKFVVFFLVNGMAAYYFTYLSGNPGLMTPFMFAANVLGIIASYLARHVVGKLGGKNSVILSYVIMAAAGLLAFVLRSNTIAVIVLMSILMFFMYISNTADPELYANCAEFSGRKLGYDVTGTVMGLLTVPIKLGIVARGILISGCLSLGAYTSAMADMAYFTEERAGELLTLQNGVCMGFMVIPAVCILAGALLLLIGYKPDKN